MSSKSNSISPSLYELKRSQEKDDQFIVSLVMAVEKNPILYDHKNSQYRNTEKKIETWNAIKEDLKYVGDTQELADYWKIVRDRYTKARRKFILKKPTKFKFLNECCFLNPHITDRSSWYEKPNDNEPNKAIKRPTDAHFYRILIQKVKENPCFYDTSDFYYRRFQHKVALWQSIAKELGFNGDHQDMYKQWKKMRDRYVRELRKLKISGKLKENCKWEFFSDMDWMERYIEEQKPLEEYESVVDKREGEECQMRQVRKIKTKRNLVPPKLQKMVDDGPSAIQIKNESGKVKTKGHSTKNNDEPSLKRRIISNQELQNSSTQYIYYLTTAGSQVQFVDSEGKVASGQIITAPCGTVINVLQSPIYQQYVVDQNPTPIENIKEQSKEVEKHKQLEIDSVGALCFDHNDFYNTNNYYEEVQNTTSTESLADEMNRSINNCNFLMDIPDNFLAEEDYIAFNNNDLNEETTNDLHHYHFHNEDNNNYESLPESFLAFS